MAKFIIAHHSDSSGVIQKEIEAESREKALRSFFDDFVGTYSKDDEGFVYFKEDFFDKECPAGAVTEY